MLPCKDANDNDVVKNSAEAGGGNLITTPVSGREQLHGNPGSGERVENDPWVMRLSDGQLWH